MSIPVYVINLPSAHKRLSRMRSLLYCNSIKFEVIAAIAGADLNPADLRLKFDHFDTMGLQPAEYGCLLSHRSVWEMLVTQNIPAAVILEDDVHISLDFKTVINGINVDYHVPTVYKLETFLATVTSSALPEQTIGKRKIVEIYTNHGGAAGYLINRSAAALLLKATAHMKYAVDTEMFERERSTVTGLRVMQVTPAICIQDMFVPKELSVLQSDSSIKVRLDDRIVVRSSAAISTIKRPLRPLVRIIRSLILSREGKRRSYVPFRF